ncbi:MAG TPA: MOSC N-terminal beta barrel domain-containing protein [Opitutaceae bacterium]|jgi:uncharacterized protein YcbX|nr:MOSC N-terminal beta barrel domain-containing protein [Opitutaceae bacterium]
MAEKIEVGSIAAVHRYPVKSMMGEELNASWIGAKGIKGDRAFAVADPETGKIASAKNPSKWPNLFSFRAVYTQPLQDSRPLPPVRMTFPDGSTVLSSDDQAEMMLSASLGKPVRFLTGAPPSGTLEEYWPDMEELPKRDVVTDEALPAETFFDLGMLHLLTTSTLQKLGELNSDGRFESRRFRPNLVIATKGEGFVENEWHDKVLAIGSEVRLKVTGPCARCVMTTLEQGDLPRDTGILKTAAKHNQARVGIYASVLSGGLVHRGDKVWLE